MRVGSLFSGIGGLDLGLERAGMSVAWQSETDPHCVAVLKRHWPNVPNLGDVTSIDWREVERVDVICGGYPCQPFSASGQRKGEQDDRHLWPYMFAAIRSLRPRFVIIENVQGHLTLGFGSVLSDLASIGFDAEWGVVSACSVGAPHLRRRLFVVAYPHSSRHEQVAPSPPSDEAPHGPESDYLALGPTALHGRSRWWAGQPRVPLLADGLPGRLVRDVNHAFGNAVVPQVAEFIGRAVMRLNGVKEVSASG